MASASPAPSDAPTQPPDSETVQQSPALSEHANDVQSARSKMPTDQLSNVANTSTLVLNKCSAPNGAPAHSLDLDTVNFEAVENQPSNALVNVLSSNHEPSAGFKQITSQPRTTTNASMSSCRQNTCHAQASEIETSSVPMKENKSSLEKAQCLSNSSMAMQSGAGTPKAPTNQAYASSLIMPSLPQLSSPTTFPNVPQLPCSSQAISQTRNQPPKRPADNRMEKILKCTTPRIASDAHGIRNAKRNRTELDDPKRNSETSQGNNGQDNSGGKRSKCLKGGVEQNKSSKSEAPSKTTGPHKAPSRKGTLWSMQEDQMLMNAYNKHGPDWVLFSSILPERSIRAIYMRFCRLSLQSSCSRKQVPSENDALHASRLLGPDKRGCNNANPTQVEEHPSSNETADQSTMNGISGETPILQVPVSRTANEESLMDCSVDECIGLRDTRFGALAENSTQQEHEANLDHSQHGPQDSNLRSTVTCTLGTTTEENKQKHAFFACNVPPQVRPTQAELALTMQEVTGEWRPAVSEPKNGTDLEPNTNCELLQPGPIQRLHNKAQEQRHEEKSTAHRNTQDAILPSDHDQMTCIPNDTVALSPSIQQNTECTLTLSSVDSEKLSGRISTTLEGLSHILRNSRKAQCSELMMLKRENIALKWQLVGRAEKFMTEAKPKSKSWKNRSREPAHDPCASHGLAACRLRFENLDPLLRTMVSANLAKAWSRSGLSFVPADIVPRVPCDNQRESRLWPLSHVFEFVLDVLGTDFDPETVRAENMLDYLVKDGVLPVLERITDCSASTAESNYIIQFLEQALHKFSNTKIQVHYAWISIFFRKVVRPLSAWTGEHELHKKFSLQFNDLAKDVLEQCVSLLDSADHGSQAVGMELSLALLTTFRGIHSRINQTAHKSICLHVPLFGLLAAIEPCLSKEPQTADRF